MINYVGSIMFIAPSAYPLGGLATWLHYIVPGLKAKGWKVLVGLTSGVLHDANAYQTIHSLPDVLPIPNKTGSRESRIRSLCKIICEARPNIVVGVNIADTYAAVERLRKKARTEAKVVMTIHGIQPDLYEDAQNFRDVIDAVICTNKLACRLTQDDAGFEAGRIYYVPDGVELPEKLRKSQKGSGPLRIAYAGRLEHFQKRVDDIPDILLQFKQKRIPFEFLVAGSGPAENAMRERMDLAGLSENVRFLGVLSSEDLVEQVYRKVDVLLVTSLWETGPIVIWEAMADGVAIVSSAYIGSDLEDSLHGGENCLLFPVGDTARAAECLQSLCDPEIINALISGGYRLVAERYSRERSIADWDNCLAYILDAQSLSVPSVMRQYLPAGGLDRLLGIELAETVRSLFGLRFNHTDPGGEWPHSYGTRKRR